MDGHQIKCLDHDLIVLQEGFCAFLENQYYDCVVKKFRNESLAYFQKTTSQSLIGFIYKTF